MVKRPRQKLRPLCSLCPLWCIFIFAFDCQNAEAGLEATEGKTQTKFNTGRRLRQKKKKPRTESGRSFLRFYPTALVMALLREESVTIPAAPQATIAGHFFVVAGL
jgi:hypothetical protein